MEAVQESNDRIAFFGSRKRWTRLLKSHGLLSLAVTAQVATVLITWPVWNERLSPPNLPVVDLPQVSFAGWVLVTACLPLAMRRWGVWLHLLVLIVACCFDQFRLQPQFFFCWLFIWAAVSDVGKTVCRWVLPAMWFWAGLHKLLSPEWLSFRSWSFLATTELGIEEFYLSFAVVVGVSEIALGLLSFWRPRAAAIPCVLMHVGIAISLLIVRWNYSVIPWNLASAVFGFRILSTCDSAQKTDRWEFVWIAVLLLSPMLFFVGWLDRGFSHVLYSGMIPQGVISFREPGTDPRKPQAELIDGWGDLNVPFPHERRLLRQYFEYVAPTGSKLHLFDPRAALPDRFYIKREQGGDSISRSQFFSLTDGSVMGTGHDDQRASFVLQAAGVRLLKRNAHAVIYAIDFSPTSFDRTLLPHLAGLPNVEQIQFDGCDLQDEDLKHLVKLLRLEGLGLSNTRVTDRGLEHLKSLPNLHYIESAGTGLTTAAVNEIGIELSD